jgi:hypothetical protein
MMLNAQGERGFGFAIEDRPLDDGKTGIFVKTITPNEPAEEVMPLRLPLLQQ